jgi:hypothetical protein
MWPLEAWLHLPRFEAALYLSAARFLADEVALVGAAEQFESTLAAVTQLMGWDALPRDHSGNGSRALRAEEMKRRALAVVKESASLTLGDLAQIDRWNAADARLFYAFCADSAVACSTQRPLAGGMRLIV